MAERKPGEPYTYGKHNNPNNWHEAADALKSIKPQRKSSGLMERLDSLERLIKEKK